MEKLRIVQIGCGKMSKYTMRYVYEKGAEIVGAFDINEKLIGKDISEIIECDNKNIKVENINLLDERLKEINPDAAIVTTMSLIKEYIFSNVLNSLYNSFIYVSLLVFIIFFNIFLILGNFSREVFKDTNSLALADELTIFDISLSIS